MEVWKNYKNVTFGIVGITRRTAEAKIFEEQRKRSQEIWGEEIEFWMQNRKNNKKPDRSVEGVTFLNMEVVVKNRHLCQDGVHMTHEGASKFFRKIATYIQIMKERREEIREEERNNLLSNVELGRPQGVYKTKNPWIRIESEIRKQEKKKEMQKKGNNSNNGEGKNG